MVQSVSAFGLAVTCVVAAACSSDNASREVRVTPSASSTRSSRVSDDFAIAFGSAERRCVATDDHEVVRSGDFVAGPFVSYRRHWRFEQRSDVGKLYWEPKDDRRVARIRLIVKAVPTGAESEPSSSWRFGGDGFAATTAQGRAFYPSGLHLPHRGRWRLTATAGTQWGCFDFEL
jgi:hypothetical protein